MAFRDVINQDHAVMLLRAAARSGRVGHAYLLVGPAGVGRRAVAMAFAQLLNCARPDGDACGECPSCRKIISGSHPDVRVLDVAGGQYLEAPAKEHRGKEIPVDQIRALRHDAAYAPYEGRWKVFIIADAERMNPSSANSLLKVLEEPPAQVVFLLVAESAVALPPTVVSRCQLIRCSFLRTDRIEQALVERWQIEPDRARVLAVLADGRLGRALAWAASEDRLEARDRLLDLLPSLEESDPLARLDAAEAMGRQPDLLPELLDLALLWYRDLLVWKQLKEPALLANRDRQAQVETLAPRFSDATLGARIEAVEAAKESLRRNVNARLALEALFLSFVDVPAPSASATGPLG
jgi:DNA polymerase-3 subunit delta'